MLYHRFRFYLSNFTNNHSLEQTGTTWRVYRIVQLGFYFLNARCSAQSLSGLKMRRIIVGLCIVFSLLSTGFVILLLDASQIEKSRLPKYLAVEKSGLEKLEKEMIIEIAYAGFLEARNLRDTLLKLIANSSKLLIGISLLMLIQVAVLAIYALRPLNIYMAFGCQEKNSTDRTENQNE